MGRHQFDRGGGKKVRKGGVGNQNRDFISALPDCIISHILSRLPARDAVRTSVLSKYWEDKWTSIYNIQIDGGRDVVNFTNEILLNVLSIQSFHLALCRAFYYDADCMNSWISTVFRRKVESVKIFAKSSYAPHGIILPRRVLNCASLKILELHMRCTLKVSVRTYFQNLSSLILDSVEISNGDSDTDTLTFEAPVLETLVLRNCKWLNVMFVKFYTPVLSSFESGSDDYRNHGYNYTIEIIGAKLSEFKTSGCELINFLFAEPTVDNAVLDILTALDLEIRVHVLENDALKLRRLLNELSNLEKLKLTTYVVKAISRTNSRLPLPKFDKLRSLVISDGCDLMVVCDMVKALFEILHAARFLKALEICMVHFFEAACDFDYTSMVHVPSCVLYELEEVKLDGICGGEPEFKLAEFMIVKGAKLKKLGISVIKCGNITTDDVEEELSRFPPQASASLTIDVWNDV